MTKTQFEKIIEDLQSTEADCEMDGIEFDDYIALETAQNALRINPGLKEYIEENFGTVKCDEWLANQF